MYFNDKLRRDRRRGYRVDCTLSPGGRFTSLGDCQSNCAPPADTTYGCDVDGACVPGRGTSAAGACTCYDCVTQLQRYSASPPTCSTTECSNPDGGPCYATNHVCYAANTDGTCPGSTTACPSSPAPPAPVTRCVVVGNAGRYAQGCGTACSSPSPSPPPTCPVGPGGRPCNGTGTCSTDQGTCSCNTGWSGADCSRAVTCPGFSVATGAACSGHGTCDTETWACTCGPGWRGADCATAAACPGGAACSGHGTCDTDTWRCTCGPGWTGADCGHAVGAVPSAGPPGYPNVSVYWGQNWADPDFGRFAEMPWIGRVIISFALATANVRLFDLPGGGGGGASTPSMPINLASNANFCSRYDCSAVDGCGVGDNIMYNCTVPNELAWEGKPGFPATYPASFSESANSGINVNAGLPFAPLPTSIKSVQAVGTEVLISVGGAVGTLPADQTSADYGPRLLLALRTQFLDLPGAFRPFGDAVLDGIDLDFEPMAHGDWFFAFLDAWDTEKMGRRVDGKGFVLTAAPEAYITSASLFHDLFQTDSAGVLVNLSRAAQIDCFQYQFYNTDISCFGCSTAETKFPGSATYFSTGKWTTQDWNIPGNCNPCPYSPNAAHPMQMFEQGDGACGAGRLVSYLQLFDSIAFQCNQWRRAHGYTQIQKFQVGVPAPPTINSQGRANTSSLDGIFRTQLQLLPGKRVEYWTDQMEQISSQLAALFPLHFQGLMLWDAAGDTGPFFVAEPGTLHDAEAVKGWTGGVRATVGADVQLSGLIARSMEAVQDQLPTTFSEWSTKLTTLVTASTFNHGSACPSA